VCAAPVAARGDGRRVLNWKISQQVDVLRLGLRPQSRSGKKERDLQVASTCEVVSREKFGCVFKANDEAA
jgi:hypothetical protein